MVLGWVYGFRLLREGLWFEIEGSWFSIDHASVSRSRTWRSLNTEVTSPPANKSSFGFESCRTRPTVRESRPLYMGVATPWSRGSRPPREQEQLRIRVLTDTTMCTRVATPLYGGRIYLIRRVATHLKEKQLRCKIQIAQLKGSLATFGGMPDTTNGSSAEDEVCHEL